MSPSFETNHGKQNFEAGWTAYVKPPLNFPPTDVPPDMYWNPREGDWRTYTTVVNDIQDKGWPKIELSVFSLASNVYDQITNQYVALSPDEQPYACWDPRRGKWMSVAKRQITPNPEPTPISKAAALDEVQAAVHNLFKKDFIRLDALNKIRNLLDAER